MLIVVKAINMTEAQMKCVRIRTLLRSPGEHRGAPGKTEEPWGRQRSPREDRGAPGKTKEP